MHTDPKLIVDETNIRLAVARDELTPMFADHLLDEARLRFSNRQEQKQFHSPEY
jgi:hypothetical protein